MREVQCAISKCGARIFRNNVGLFRTADGRKVQTGLCVGSSDLIGWYNGKFLAIEVKRPKQKVPEHQQNFINQINQAGGIAFIATSAEEAVKKLWISQQNK